MVIHNPLDSLAWCPVAADNQGMLDNDRVQIHPRWVEAEAAVQADIDRDVLDEAAGLAEAELSQIALVDLINDSIGAFIQLRIKTGSSQEVIAGVLSGAVASAISGTKLHWLVIDASRAINVDSLIGIRGLKRFVSPLTDVRVSHPKVSRELGLHAWLRDRIGLRVVVHTGTHDSAGILSEVGTDFLSCCRGAIAELIPLSSIDSLEIS